MKKTDNGPHQPKSMVSACMSRNEASAQVRQNIPSRRRNRITSTMPWWPRISIGAAGEAPHT
ncbi:hypothetical protein ACGFYV_27165 [Streptomyces sp. NPDC048297]|uniref:hypothetical protein n=1 Tax=Streptomyces sp. NPDC048297 TaxID=3365531 RepID=UPI003715C253